MLEVIPTSLVCNELDIVEQLLVELRPIAARFAQMAPNYYDKEDLMNSAIMRVLECVRKGCKRDLQYFKGIARKVMTDAIRRVHQDVSLDGYLYDEETGMHRDIADTHQDTPVATLSQRRRVFKAVATLSSKQQDTLLAYYQVPDHRGKCKSVESVYRKYGITKTQFNSVRSAAIHRAYVYSMN